MRFRAGLLHLIGSLFSVHAHVRLSGEGFACAGGVGFCGYNLSEATGLDSKNLMDLLSDTIELGSCTTFQDFHA